MHCTEACGECRVHAIISHEKKHLSSLSDLLLTRLPPSVPRKAYDGAEDDPQNRSLLHLAASHGFGRHAWRLTVDKHASG